MLPPTMTWINLIGTAKILAGVHGIAAIVTRRSLPPTSVRETTYRPRLKILVDHAISHTRPYFFLTVRPFLSLLPSFLLGTFSG